MQYHVTWSVSKYSTSNLISLISTLLLPSQATTTTTTVDYCMRPFEPFCIEHLSIISSFFFFFPSSHFFCHEWTIKIVLWHIPVSTTYQLTIIFINLFIQLYKFILVILKVSFNGTTKAQKNLRHIQQFSSRWCWIMIEEFIFDIFFWRNQIIFLRRRRFQMMGVSYINDFEL